MTASQDTVNNVLALVGGYRRKLIENSRLPSHTKVNLHEFDPVLEQHLPELLAFTGLEAAQSNLTATTTLAATVNDQARIATEQAHTSKTLLKLTWGLLIVAAGTLAASTVLLAALLGHF